MNLMMRATMTMKKMMEMMTDEKVFENFDDEYEDEFDCGDDNETLKLPASESKQEQNWTVILPVNLTFVSHGEKL